MEDDMGFDNAQVGIHTSLDTEVEKAFNVDEYKDIRKKLQAKYEMQDGGGYTSKDIGKAKRSIDSSARNSVAKKAFKNETLQELYSLALSVMGKNAKKIYADSTRSLESDIEKDFDLLRSVENMYYGDMRDYDNNTKKLLDLFEQERQLGIAKEGYAQEMEEIKYILDCKKSQKDVDVSKLSIVEPSIIDKEITQLSETLRNYNRSVSRLNQDMTRVYLNQTILGQKLESSELLQGAYENDMDTIMKGIISTIEQISGGYPTDVGNVLDVKLDIAERMEHKEYIVNRHKSTTSAILQKTAEYKDILLNPYKPSFNDFGEADSAKDISDSIKARSADNAITLDGLKIHSDMLKNKYKNLV